MVVIFGKGKVGNGLVHLLSLLGIPHILMDDQDFDEAILTEAEVVLVSPGIKQSHTIYQHYYSKIQSELQFLSGLLPRIGLSSAERIGVTATNGKSTTTWVLYQVFKAMFPQRNVWITGNFDIPVSEVLAQIIEKNKQREDHIFVVECSSFMLYGLRDFTFDYSILLNIARDHLDWHKDFDEYQESKLTLLRRTNKAFFVPVSSRSLLDSSLSSRGVKVEESFDLSSTKFLGKHNEVNLSTIQSLILSYCKNLGLEEQVSKNRFLEIIQHIEPLPHRLGLLREFRGVAIYDDGICTSSHSLSAALSSFSEKLVLIVGGYDKGDQYDWLSELFISKVGFAVLMGQTTSKFIRLCESSHIRYCVVSSLQDGVYRAFEEAKKNNLQKILYSPGAASFDMFKNVYDRVAQFEHVVKELSA